MVMTTNEWNKLALQNSKLNESPSEELMKKQQELEKARYVDKQVRDCFNNHWKETAEYFKQKYPEEFI
jgi:hypothetical protein